MVANQTGETHKKPELPTLGIKKGIKMDVRTDKDSDAVTVISALLLCLIKSYFDIWNSASRASLTSLKKSTSCSRFPRHKLGVTNRIGLRSGVPEGRRGRRTCLARKLIINKRRLKKVSNILLELEIRLFAWLAKVTPVMVI